MEEARGSDPFEELHHGWARDEMDSTSARRHQKHGGRYECFEEWFARERCPGSPTNPRRFIRLAESIRDRDFLEGWVRDALLHCFNRFDPVLGRLDQPVEERFVRFFKSRLRRKWQDASSDGRSRERAKSCLRYAQWKDELASACPSELAYQHWARVILREAVNRLDEEARRFVENHVYREMTMAETAEALGSRGATSGNTGRGDSST
jgi:hypothetical protein